MQKQELNKEKNPNERRLFPTWTDVKQVLQFKTAYFALVIGLLGLTTICLDIALFGRESESIFKGILLALGVTLLTSSTITILTEAYLKLDIVELVTSRIRNLFPTSSRHPFVLDPKQASSLRLPRSGVDDFTGT